MNTKRLFVAVFIISTLSGCVSSIFNDLPNVDRRTQLRSMIYTQRELLAMELAEPSPKKAGRYATLMQSYCDLADRQVILLTGSVDVCGQPFTNPARQCMAQFHFCVNSCNFRLSQCFDCELKAEKCLEET